MTPPASVPYSPVPIIDTTPYIVGIAVFSLIVTIFLELRERSNKERSEHFSER